MSTTRPAILLCTLGASWAVIPEVLGFLEPERTVDLYQNHPDHVALLAKRAGLDLPPVTEVWVVTTADRNPESITAKCLGKLKQWRDAHEGKWRQSPGLTWRFWYPASVSDIITEDHVQAMRELIYRVALKAAEEGEVVACLTGGRKTMSSDLQAATRVFGARAVFHVVADDSKLQTLFPPKGLDDPELLKRPLTEEVAELLRPVVVARSQQRAEVLDVKLGELDPVATARFPLPNEEQVTLNQGPRLCDEVARREMQGHRLLWSHVASLSSSEPHDNWRSLDRLPPRLIAALKRTSVDARHTDFLRECPKVDLHRHLGGCLDLEAQRRVGRAVWDALEGDEKAQAQANVADLLRSNEWCRSWPAHLKGLKEYRTQAVAALLVEADDGMLRRNLFEVTEPRRALRETKNDPSRGPNRGFPLYEQPGELTGSAILGHEAAIVPYAEEAVKTAQAEGLVYAELRGSPLKYLSGDKAGALDFLRRFGAAVTAAQGSTSTCRLGFIVIADRRRQKEIPLLVEVALEARQEGIGLVVGIDLAGDEGTPYDESLMAHFTPAFRECVPFTIHAGEGEPADNIWKAAYHLNADRVGHGLTLATADQMARRFRDRGICLELCPTSNLEVVGYREKEPETAGRDPYPLRKLLELELPVTLATDNPGISRTTLANEYLVASTLVEAAGEEPLSLWEALGLIRRGFEHTFQPAPERRALLRQADDRIFRLIEEAQDRLLADVEER